MAKQYYFGPCPADETCAQVGDEDYRERALAEAHAYVNQIYRFLEREGHPKKDLPEGFKVKLSEEPHDLGSYIEVVCTFAYNNPRAQECHDLALLIDYSCPSEWDEEAKIELGVTRV